jgi:hypothetical protein
MVSGSPGEKEPVCSVQPRDRLHDNSVQGLLMHLSRALCSCPLLAWRTVFSDAFPRQGPQEGPPASLPQQGPSVFIFWTLHIVYPNSEKRQFGLLPCSVGGQG